MIHIHTRQNIHGNWWCNGTIEGYDHSFEGESIDDAQLKMSELLAKNGIREAVWQEPAYYPETISTVPASVFCRPFRIDKGMV